MDEKNLGSSGEYDLDSGPEKQLEVVEEGYGKYKRTDERDPEEEARRIKSTKRAFYLTLLAIVAAVGMGITLSVSKVDLNDEERLQEITSLTDASYLFAQEDTTAVGEIRRRFQFVGDQLPFTDGMVVRCLFLNYPVEIWVGICTLQELAAEAYSLLLQETDPDQNPNWRSQSNFIRGTTAITQAVGRGQRSYFYRDSNMIVWIGADSLTAPFALEATLNTNLREWLDSIRQGG
jgi:hypothetical protein